MKALVDRRWHEFIFVYTDSASRVGVAPSQLESEWHREQRVRVEGMNGNVE